jgi:hypothetical protein
VGVCWGTSVLKELGGSLFSLSKCRSQFSSYVMVGGNERRVAIKFCFKAGLSATETIVLVQKSYGNEALNRPNFLGGIIDFETEESW